MVVNPSPQRKLEVTFANKKIQLFMSYGLLSQVTMLIGGADRLPMLASDLDMQEKVLCAVCTERSENNKAVLFEPKTADEIDMDLDDVQRTLDWVGEHVTDFFLKRTLRTIQQVEHLNKTVEEAGAKLLLSKTGSPSSVSGTDAA